MFAVLKTGGKQYKVQSGDVIRVEKLDGVAGDTIEFDHVLMLGGDDPTLGTPVVDGALVTGEVVDQVKGEKVVHFVKRRRKHSSKRTKGHRQKLTMVRITDILMSGESMVGAAEAPVDPPQDEAPSPAPVAETAGSEPSAAPSDVETAS